jgi:hypothetical protein
MDFPSNSMTAKDFPVPGSIATDLLLSVVAVATKQGLVTVIWVWINTY